MKKILMIGILVLAFVCLSIGDERLVRLVKASWYGPGFHGKRAANTEIYDMHGFTAAHRTLPLGTKVKITNPENGKSVVVEITDRGPYIATREIDLSYGAAKEISLVEKGVGWIKMEVLEAKTQFYFYRVKKGQTLWDLFGLNWEIVAEINKVSPERIRPGMKLAVPYDFGWAEKEYSSLAQEISVKRKES